MVRHRQTSIALIFLALGLGSAGCDGADAKPRAEGPGARAAEAPREVRLVAVAATDFEDVIEISGTLAADEQVMLATKVPGRLSRIEDCRRSRTRRTASPDHEATTSSMRRFRLKKTGGRADATAAAADEPA